MRKKQNRLNSMVDGMFTEIRSYKKMIDMNGAIIKELVEEYSLNKISDKKLDYIEQTICENVNQSLEIEIDRKLMKRDTFASVYFDLGNISYINNYYIKSPCISFIAYGDNNINQFQIEIIKREGEKFVDKIFEKSNDLKENPTLYFFPIPIIDGGKYEYYLYINIFNHMLLSDKAFLGIVDLSILYDSPLT